MIPEGSSKAPECDERVYGLRPSSLLTSYATLVAVFIAVCLPVVGAIVDHTEHRKRFGQVTALIQLLLVLILSFISETNWIFMAIVQVFSAVVGWLHALVVFAYLPELTNNAPLLVKWTANFHMLQFIALMLYLALMAGLLIVLGYTDNDVLSARIACGVALIIAVPLFTWSWTTLMQKRGSLSKLPEGSSLGTIGFVKVWKTAKQLFHEYRALMWFFVTVALTEAAQASLIAISLTFMTDTLQMTVTENSIAIFVLLLFGALGTVIGQVSVKYINPIRSYQLCLLIAAATTTVGALILNGPGQQIRVYSIGSFWGIGTGWKVTVERFTVTQLIPKDQDAEMMGFYMFSSQIMIWSPNLIFTSMNEAGIDQRIGVAMLNIFFLGGIVTLCFMGPYCKARELVHPVYQV